ncbi:Glycogen recognition site of AMP-activated protein kinase [Lutibacter oricola]|uniref:Glycogen recognition site of AMP-activated protein kinase n=1 Tax=Lutibacter oricola TaxID=762486 RepID=A0A1H2Z9H9_9FLAO|nr:hypothetical protein [Lutibacter oricola]SDX13985.1 Glycogen recognition site of AMP-activated protein kinase [Lutibacter oricola]
MKNTIKHIITICLVILSLHSFSQTKELKGYKIDGDEIVFTFDKRDYKRASKTLPFFGKFKNFEDIDIKSVGVSGNFNNWSMKNWKMKKVSENIYELRKKINNFSNNFTWEFKFVVNEYYWAEPSKKDINSIPASKDGRPLYVYNLKLFTSLHKENGNAKFKLKGYPNAKKVILSGTFNKWDERVFQMKKQGDDWVLNLELKPDIYEYKFIVDGDWISDPDNKNFKDNEHGTKNSILNISKKVTFNLYDCKEANEVILCGSFNNWNEDEIKMSKTQKGWTFSMLLKSGKHHYKYIVDGNWITDPFNSVKEFDENGNINSVIMIK